MLVELVWPASVLRDVEIDNVTKNMTKKQHCNTAINHSTKNACLFQLTTWTRPTNLLPKTIYYRNIIVNLIKLTEPSITFC